MNDSLKVSFTQAQPEDVFIIFKFASAFAAQSTVFDGPAGNAMRLYRSAAGQLNMYSGSALALSALSGAGLETNFHRWRFTYNGASSAATQDGTSKASGNAGTNSAGGFTLGAFADGSVDWSAISVAEVIMYDNVISAGNLAVLDRYINLRYGL